MLVMFPTLKKFLDILLLACGCVCACVRHGVYASCNLLNKGQRLLRKYFLRVNYRLCTMHYFRSVSLILM